MSDIDDLASALDDLSDADVGDNASIVPPGQRPCPICGEHMQIDDTHGIDIDVCPKHGVWLDAGELPAIAARARSGERRSRSRMIRNAKRDGKISGMLLGGWSLLLD